MQILIVQSNSLPTWYKLQGLDDRSCVLVCLRLSAQVTSQALALCQCVENSLLNSVGVVVELHVSQHHDGGQKQGSWVGKCLAGDIWGGTVDSLEDGAFITNVTRWSETETANETSAHVRENVTIQVGHDQDLVVVRSGVGNNLQAGVVEKLGVKLNGWEILGNSVGSTQEETITHLHDGSLVYCADLWSSNVLGVLESESEHTFRSLSCDELDRLHNAVNNDMLNARVFTLSVLSDQDSVHVIVRGLVPID
jgi:hypothetical protein